MCVLLGSSGQIASLRPTDVIEYIQEMREMLHTLQNRIQKAKQNVEGITQAMQVRGLPGTRDRGQGAEKTQPLAGKRPQIPRKPRDISLAPILGFSSLNL